MFPAVAIARERARHHELRASEQDPEADHLRDACQRARSTVHGPQIPRRVSATATKAAARTARRSRRRSRTDRRCGAGNGATVNYFPSSGSCSANIGNDTKVNQNCLNLTDPSLQGRGQANNEPSISVDPFNSQRLVASDNNYIRGDGTCGSYFSQNGGRSWSNTTIPNGFTTGTTRDSIGNNAREYWQAGGDTSVAWDTRGNAYESCQLFNRGTVASANPDQSSTFVLFRATQNGGASWNFPGRYSVPHHIRPTGDVRRAPGQGPDGDRRQRQQPVPRPHLRHVDGVRRRRHGVHLRGSLERLRRDVQQPGSGQRQHPTCTNSSERRRPRRHATRTSSRIRSSARTEACTWLGTTSTTSPRAGPTTTTRCCWPSRPTAARRSRRRCRSAAYYDLPDCDTYQGAGADHRALVRAGEGLLDGVGLPRHELSLRARSIRTTRTSSP